MIMILIKCFTSLIFGHPKKPQVELLGTPLEADVEAMQAANSES